MSEESTRAQPPLQELARLRVQVAELEAREAVYVRTQAQDRVLHRLLGTANQSTEMTSLLEAIVAQVQSYTGCAAVGVRLLDEQGRIPYQFHVGFSQSFYAQESPLSIHADECMCINVIKGETDPALPYYTQGGSFYMNGTTRFLATVSEEAKGRMRNMCNRVGYESVALMPIRAGGRIIGLIHVADPDADNVLLEIVESLEEVGMALGGNLWRIWMEQAQRRRTEELAALYATSLEINAQRDPSALLPAIVARAVKLLGVHIGGLYLMRPDDESLELAVGHNLPDDYVGITLRLGEGIAGRVAQTGEVLMVEDYRSWAGCAAAYTDSPFRRVLAVPLNVGGKVLGVLNVSDECPGEFSQDEVRLLDLFADQAAIALESARLVQALRESEARLAEAERLAHLGSYQFEAPQEGMHWSDEMFRIMGRDPALGEPTSAEAAQYVHPDDWPLVQQVMAEAVNAQKPFDLEYRILLTDGSLKHVHNIGQPILDTASGTVSIFGTLMDITAHKQADQERERLIGELQGALGKVKQLSGMLPICASCKKIRDDRGYWQQLEVYIRDHSEVEFSHSLCPECLKKLYPDLYTHGSSST